MSTRQVGRTLHAGVDRGLLAVAATLFVPSAEAVLRETVQNARRAGATRIAVDVARLADGRVHLRIEDDGAGCSDPALVLEVGRSGWERGIREREGAAGMGMAVLAETGDAAVHSRSADAPEGWTVRIDRSAVEGTRPVEVEPLDRSRGPHTMGTVVECTVRDGPRTEAASAARAMIEAAGLAGSVDGVEVAPGPKRLAGEVRRRVVAGDEYVVVRSAASGGDADPGWAGIDLVVHGTPCRGLRVQAESQWRPRRPAEWLRVVALLGEGSAVRLAAPGHEAPEPGAAFDLVRDRAMAELAAAGNEIEDWQPTAASWHRIEEATGVQWPEPGALLARWRLEEDAPSLERVPAGSWVLPGDLPVEDALLLAQALRAEGAPKAFEEDPGYRGFGWYEGLAHVAQIRTVWTGDHAPEREGAAREAVGLAAEILFEDGSHVAHPVDIAVEGGPTAGQRLDAATLRSWTVRLAAGTHEGIGAEERASAITEMLCDAYRPGEDDHEEERSLAAFAEAAWTKALQWCGAAPEACLRPLAQSAADGYLAAARQAGTVRSTAIHVVPGERSTVVVTARGPAARGPADGPGDRMLDGEAAAMRRSGGPTLGEAVASLGAVMVVEAAEQAGRVQIRAGGATVVHGWPEQGPTWLRLEGPPEAEEALARLAGLATGQLATGWVRRHAERCGIAEEEARQDLHALPVPQAVLDREVDTASLDALEEAYRTTLAATWTLGG